MPGHLYRFSRLLQEVKRILDSGELGEGGKAVNMRWVTPVPASGTDLMLDLLPHCLDIIHGLFRVLPGHPRMLDLRPYNQQHVFLRYLFGDAVVSIELGWGLPEKHRFIEIMGDEKWLSTDVVKSFQFLYLTDPRTGKREERWVTPNNTLCDQVRGFLANIEHSDYSLAEAAVEGLKLLEASR